MVPQRRLRSPMQFSFATITVKRKLRPCRYVLMSGRGRTATPIRFRYQASFRHEKDARMVAYWLRRDAREERLHQ